MQPMAHERSNARLFATYRLKTRHFLEIARRKASVCDRIHTFSRSHSEHLPQPSQNPVRFCPSSRLKQIHPHRRCARWRQRGQPQMSQDAGDGGRFFDGRDQLQ